MDIGVLAPDIKSGRSVRDAAATRRVLLVAIMVSMVAFLDGTVVNLALPATQRDLGGGLTLQQWVVDGYLLALAATILPGGSIADLFGRARVMRFGLATFGMGLLLAATAASPAMLIAGRVIQGLGGAFLVPGSLAMINSAFDRADRPAAIGSWTAWTASAFALGPLLGGLAVDHRLEMDLCVVGYPDGRRLRIDVLAVPDARPVRTRTRRHRRGRVVGDRTGRGGLWADRISPARMGRPGGHRVDGVRGRGLAGVRRMGAPRRAPHAAAGLVAQPATSPVPIWPPPSSTAR